jgi:protocatechuate 3,4-dioxygenase beta subunit
MTARLCTFAAAVVIATTGQGQQPARDAPPAQPAGRAIVSGTVLLGPAGNDPSRRTRVTLNTTDRSIAGRTATTDDEGRFTFQNVPAGRFTLQAARPGYLTASYGARRPARPGTAVVVTDGAQVEDLTLRLIKGGVITGTVLDANGQPAAGVPISVLRYIYRELTGELALSTETIGSSTTTDDRGAYRAWGLTPGNYLVMARPQLGSGGRSGVSDFQPLTTNDVARAIATARERATGGGPPATPPAARVNYAPVFFPGTPDVSQASMVTLKEPEERTGIDMAIRLFRTARIEATLRMADGSALPASVPVSLTPGGAQGDLLGSRGAGRIQSATADAQGKVLFASVSPGTYTVMANTARPGGRGTIAPPSTTTAVWAMTEVTIDGTDVTLQLSLQPAMKGSGRLVFQGTSEPPKNLTAARIALVPPGAGGSLSAGPQGGQVSADGTFTFANVTPGSYRIVVVGSIGASAAGWSVQSATVNGRDGWDQWAHIEPGENAEIRITYTDRPTEIAGTLRDAGGQPLPEHFIVVFPADKSRWIPGTKRIGVVRPGTDGLFSVTGLPAGNYLLVALSDVEPGEWNDPAFLETLAPNGIRISLGEGERKRQDLQIK